MTREKILEDLQKIFLAVFDIEELEITEETKPSDIEDWDSIEHITLLISIEKHYNVKFGIDEIKDVDNVKKMIDYIERKTR